MLLFVLYLKRERGGILATQNSNEEIGKRVATLRKRQHLTQDQLAEKVGVTSKHISEIERGVTGISIDLQIQLGEYLRCSMDYLIKGQEYINVDSLLPTKIIEILQSQDAYEIEILSEYLKIYKKIHKC